MITQPESTDRAAPIAAALPATPYVGLVPYGEADAAFFFGRVKEQRVIAGNLRASRLTIVYGPSGVGKTSLLQAGVIHGLRERVIENAASDGERAPFAICAFAAWRDDPLGTLVKAIRASAVEATGVELPAWRPGEPLLNTLRAWTEQVRTLLVVLDQFEDYFLYHADEDGEGTFATEFPRIVNEPNLRVNFAVSIREDAWAKLDRFKGDIPRLFSNYVRVEHLRPEAAGQAIEGPIAEWNRRSPADEQAYTIEPELVRAVLETTAAGRLALAEGGQAATPETVSTDGIEAPFLQLVMERLWRATVQAGARELTLARLAELGGAERIVETHLHDALGGLSREEQGVTADMFRYLVTRSKTKIAHSATDLAEWTKRPEPAVSAVLEKLCRGESGRILRPVEAPKQTDAIRYELFHDMLAEPILDWRRAYEQRRARRRWAGAGAGLLALVAVFAALGAWALVQRSNAREQAARARGQARVAESQRLATLALANAGQDLDQAALLSLEAYRIKPTFEARNAILTLVARLGRSVGMLVDHTDGVTAVAFSPDGRTFITTGDGSTVRLWDTRTHRALGPALKGDSHGVDARAFSPDGRTLASAGNDGTVRLWDVHTLRARGTLMGHVGKVFAVAFSPDGRTLASADDDGTVRLWDARTDRALVTPLHGHTGPVYAVAFSPDGRTLASGGDDGTIRLWDRRTGHAIGTPLQGDNPVEGIAFAPDGRTLASADVVGVRLWDTRTHRALGPPLKGSTGTDTYNLMAFSPDGRTIASVGYGGTVLLTDARTGRALAAPLKRATRDVVALAFSPDGRTLASAGDGIVQLWDMRASRALDTSFEAHTDVIAMAFSPDGRMFASAGEDRTVRLWDARTHRALGTPLRGHAGRIFGLVFAPDGRTLASASEDGTVRLWDARTHRALGSPLEGHAGRIFGLAFSPDGRTLAAGGTGGTVRLWDAHTRRALGPPLKGHKGSVNAVAFSPDGRVLASADEGGTVGLWDARTRRALGPPLKGHNGPVDAVAFGPDGRTLASAGVDGTVRLWDVRNRRALGTPLRGQADGVLGVVFSPDGRTLASAGVDGTVRLWDVRNRRALGTPLRADKHPVNAVAFAPDGRTLASAGDDKTVRLWNPILWSDEWKPLHDRVCEAVGHNLSKTDWHSLLPNEPYHRTCA